MSPSNLLRKCTLTLAVVTVSAIGGPAAARFPFDELLVFGDSTSDSGNVWNLTGLHIHSDPPYLEGRFSNGPVWVDRLAARLGFDPLIPSEANAVIGNNYAYGGAEAGPGFSLVCAPVDGVKTCAPNIGKQIENFLSLHNRTLDGDELIIVQGGANNNNGKNAAVHIGGHIATLAGAGGEFFLVPYLERLSQYPGFDHSDRHWNKFVADFNETLGSKLAALEETFAGITIVRMDLTGLTDDLISDPGLYGLTNVTDPACPGCNFVGVPPGPIVENPDEFMYWDQTHFTAAVHQVIGDFAYDELLAAFPATLQSRGGSAIPEPASFLLAIAVVAASLSRRLESRRASAKTHRH